ncbi:MAG: hypothetical protein ACFB8W_15170 [Elainellaceae cyanobacterium]
MLDQLTLVLATPIAKAILDKFYEGVGGKLGEKAVELIPDKVKQLGQFVWDRCLRSKLNTDKLLERAANGSTEDQEKLKKYLHKVLDADPTLRQEAQKLAEEIRIEVNNDFGQMTQINKDQSTGYQTKTGANNTNYFGGTHHHH